MKSFQAPYQNFQRGILPRTFGLLSVVSMLANIYLFMRCKCELQKLSTLLLLPLLLLFMLKCYPFALAARCTSMGSKGSFMWPLEQMLNFKLTYTHISPFECKCVAASMNKSWFSVDFLFTASYIFQDILYLSSVCQLYLIVNFIHAIMYYSTLGFCYLFTFSTFITYTLCLLFTFSLILQTVVIILPIICSCILLLSSYSNIC